MPEIFGGPHDGAIVSWKSKVVVARCEPGVVTGWVGLPTDKYYSIYKRDTDTDNYRFIRILRDDQVRFYYKDDELFCAYLINIPELD